MEQVTVLVAREARTGFLHAGLVAMVHHHGVRKELVEFKQQFHNLRFLLRGTGVGRVAVPVQSALIADADAATVVSAGMCPNLQQASVLCHDTAPTDIEMITHGTEAPGLMVTKQLFHRIVTVTACGGAEDDEEADRVRPAHHQPALHLGQ